MEKLFHVLKAKQNEVLAAFPAKIVRCLAAESDYRDLMGPCERLYHRDLGLRSLRQETLIWRRFSRASSPRTRF